MALWYGVCLACGAIIVWSWRIRRPEEVSKEWQRHHHYDRGWKL